ncbi:MULTISPECIES: bpX6 domain-containing protein [unclassified Massilia]|uniref:bpX6 domain-containing protein n=1 Tax=unclassified Massilia TaxID=2609279 RepID=UPI00177DEF5D|nr:MULTISPECIES: bpX6 domain-containing protein [unclassified Massilia]MBD8528860.1 hypothetical protein [Massilia sp. CFBP 13647]MBD8673502.1 hypothetical protein [Massilia sp. CFBP 13721]
MTEVRRPLLRGSQPVRALWFDAALLGEDAARRRLLGAWETGAQAWRLGDGYLLAWKDARRLQCETAPGLPLCDQDGVLASAPLLAGERAGIAAGSAVLVFGASLRVHALDAASRIDPSSWLDTSAIPVCVALALPADPLAGFASAVPKAAPDVRTLLGSAVPPPSAERDAFLRAAVRQAGMRAASPSLPARALGAAGMLAGLLAGLLQPLALLRGPGGTADAIRASRPDPPPAPSPLGEWLAARVATLAAATRIAHLLGWRQANYLRKMLRQFDEGNLDEALRHAIPLDSPHAPTRQALGRWGRRDSLDVGPGTSAAAIGLDQRSIQLLRATYQRSFDMLDRAGRIDEAVFVLAELMNRRQEAVDYLERKGRIAQAAQLAETLELAPAIAVRLHAKAGNLARAVLLARLAGCFADAVAELERRRDAGAAALRLEWAHDLAARGNLAEAAQAVWPLAEERARALDWLHAAEAGGGTLGVQGLLYLLALDPQALRARSATLQTLLTAPGPDALRQRLRACACLLRLDRHNASTRTVAAALWRVLAAERGAGLHALADDTMTKLLELAADPVLTEDTPHTGWRDAPVPMPLAARDEPLQVSLAEVGLHALEDVRALPDGGHLLALGEGGVVLAREGGRAPLRFPVPAQHLVVSHNGRRALALARREKAVRVSRIDLVTGKVEDWFSADLRFWADAFDGATWSVVADRRLLVLDATAPGQSVLWQVADLPGEIIGFAAQGKHEALLLRDGTRVAQWRYALPARRLVGRDAVDVPDGAFAVLPDCDGEMPVVLGAAGAIADGTAYLSTQTEDGMSAQFAWPHDRLPQASLHVNCLLLRVDDSDGWHCQWMNFSGKLLADIVLPDALAPQATVHGGHLLAWDRRGRVVDIALADAAVRMLTFG